MDDITNGENNIQISCNSYNPSVDSRKFILFPKLQKIYPSIYIHMNNELFVEAYENQNLYEYQLKQKIISISSSQGRFVKDFPSFSGTTPMCTSKKWIH